jgi:hypothetical protein
VRTKLIVWLTVLFVGFGLSGACGQVGEGLIGYWPFDGGSNAGTPDVSANRNTALLNRFPGDGKEWVAGVIGNALRFRGPEVGEYVRVPNYPKPSAAMTVCAWAWADARPTWASIAKNWGSSETGQFHFGLTGSDGDLSCYITTTGGRVVNARESRGFPLGSWEHVAFTADGTSLVLYRNGSEAARTAYSGTIIATSMASMGIGVKLDNSGLAPDTGAPGYWQGSIDDLGIWSRALSGSEITAIYEAGRQGRSLTNAEPKPAIPGPIISGAGFSPVVLGTNDFLTVTCSVSPLADPVTNVMVHWRTMFGDVHAQSMSGGEQGYSATITNQSATGVSWRAGDLVRWYITADDTGGASSRWPPFTNKIDAAEYLGTVVAPSLVSTSTLPVLHWFVGDPAAAETDAGTRCCLFYGSNYYDNTFVRIRGGTSRYWPKKSYKFEFNSGDRFQVRPGALHAHEFDLNTTYTDKSYVRAVLASDFQQDAGLPTPDAFHMHVRQNGGFFSLAIYVEHPDEHFLRRNGFDAEGALYKALGDPLGTYEKKTRLNEDDSDLKQFMAAVSDADGVEKFLFDQVNLPGVINYMAAVAVTQNIDASDKNHYLYRDTNGTGEWRIFPWDLDLTFGPDYLNTDTIVFGLCDLSSPHCPSHPFIGARPYLLHSGKYHPLLEAIVNTPRTREMLLRRIRSLADQYLGSGYFQDHLDRLYMLLESDVALDLAKWQGAAHFAGATYTLRQALDRIEEEYLTPRLGFLRGTGIPGVGTAMPDAQPAGLFLNIGGAEVNPAGGNQDEEFIRLDNTNEVAVDISGWTLSGAVEHTFEPGTVIPAGEALYASPDAAAFRARTNFPGGGRRLFVQGNYDGQLSARGEALLLSDGTGRLVGSTNLPGAPSLAQRYLRITELMYHPSAAPGNTNDSGLFEFIELRNVSSNVSLDLRGVRFTEGVAFDFTSSAITNLAPGGTVVLVRNLAAFLSRYDGGAAIAGQYTGALDNSGERIRLEDASGEKILEFSYDTSWYPVTDGGGASLVAMDDLQSWDAWTRKSGWRSSAYIGGTPGFQEPAFPVWEAIRPADQQVILSFRLPMGVYGSLEYKNRLTDSAWIVLPGTVFGAGASLCVTDTNAPSNSRFYRLRMW